MTTNKQKRARAQCLGALNNVIKKTKGETTLKKQTSTKKKVVRKQPRKQSKKQHPYVEPKTAAELGMTCLAESEGITCGKPVIWFDYEIGEKNFHKGFVCDSHKTSTRLEKLAQPQTATVTM
jgi:hypothetical protein